MSAEFEYEESEEVVPVPEEENGEAVEDYAPERKPHYSREHRGGGHEHRLQAMTVYVDERGIEPALRAFKKLVAKEGLLKDLKRRQSYEKPGARKRRKQREASRRRRRQEARLNRRFR